MEDLIFNPLFPLLLVLGVAVLVLVFELLRSIRIVPARTALIVERVGKYSGTLDAGFHLLVPFLDKVRYTHTLKETALASATLDGERWAFVFPPVIYPLVDIYLTVPGTP